MSACSFFPDQGVGQLIAPYIMKHVYMIYHVPPGGGAPLISDAAQALLASPSVLDSVTGSVAEAIATAAQTAKIVLETAVDAVTETLGVAEPSAVLEPAYAATEAAAGTVSEAVAVVVSDGAEMLATTLSVVAEPAAAITTAASAAIENLSTAATAAAESTVRFITVDSVPAHIVEAALATASAAMSAALEESTATS